MLGFKEWITCDSEKCTKKFEVRLQRSRMTYFSSALKDQQVQKEKRLKKKTPVSTHHDTSFQI